MVCSRVPVVLLTALLALAGRGPLPADGFKAFFARQAGAAKAAVRKGDLAAAEAAWQAVLEADPASIAGLQGLVDVARLRQDADAEALAGCELLPLLVAAVAAGETSLEQGLAALRERQAEIDPFSGAAGELLAEWRDAQVGLAEAYAAEGLHALALDCWSAVVGLTEPGSALREQAHLGIERSLREGGDHVARIEVPRAELGGKDAAWIEQHDLETAKWNKAARLDTPHYRIRTNAGWRMLQGAAQAMEGVHAFYREIWGIVPDPAPARVDPGLRDITVPPIALNIYSSREEYLKRSGAPEWSGGVFTGSEVSTYNTGGAGASWRSSLTTLFHEASHQFMHEAVGPSAPSFVNEGVACLFEGIELLPNGSIRRDLPVMNYLDDLVTKIRRGTLLPLAEVMTADNDPEFYASRWGLMYYLRMAVDEQGGYLYRDRFDDYIYEFKKGAIGNLPEHFTQFFIEPVKPPGITNFAEFEKAWRQWLLDLKHDLSSGDERLDGFRKEARLEALKKDHAAALRFNERILDLEPGDVDATFGVAAACAELGQADRAVFMARRFLQAAPETDERRKAAAAIVERLDPHAQDVREARAAFVGGMAALALRYDGEQMPLMAMRIGYDVLEVDPYEPSARALVQRLQRETGRSVIRWERLANGYDLSGWWPTGDDVPFTAEGGAIVCDYSRVAGVDQPGDEGASIYRTLFVDRTVRGDWTFEARLHTGEDWEIAGLVFGARDAEHYEAVVLRRSGADDRHNVDFGSFDGAWTFRGDGSYKAAYDPAGKDGVLLRITVRGREVAVDIDGVRLPVVVDKKPRESINYPSAALRGDLGLLGSKGRTRFTDLRLLAGRVRA